MAGRKVLRMEESGRLPFSERLIASTAEGLTVLEPGSGRIMGSMRLDGACAVCCGRRAVYCAADDGAIWRIDPDRLSPTAIFSGGPGITSLCVDAREERLYALCADADSLLMCCAQSGQPLLLNRAGLNPQSMIHARAEGLIVVAGGEDEHVLVFCDKTLQLADVLPVKGIACAASLRGNMIYALSMEEAQSCLLTAAERGGKIRRIRLPGLPGMLLAEEGGVIAAAGNRLYAIDPEGSAVTKDMRMPARTGKMISFSGREGSAAILDRAAQNLYMRTGALSWSLVMTGVRDMARSLRKA